MTQTQKVAAPKGYQKRSDNVVGYWDPDRGPIHCIPRSAKIFDGKLDSHKQSTLIVAELVDPCEVTGPGGDVIPAGRGEVVGIWAKPGMRDVADCAGVKCFIQVAGEKDVGRPSPMKLFSVDTENDVRKPLPVTDTRDKSKGTWTIFSKQPSSGDNDGDETPPDDGDEPNF